MKKLISLLFLFNSLFILGQTVPATWNTNKADSTTGLKGGVIGKTNYLKHFKDSTSVNHKSIEYFDTYNFKFNKISTSRNDGSIGGRFVVLKPDSSLGFTTNITGITGNIFIPLNGTPNLNGDVLRSTKGSSAFGVNTSLYGNALMNFGVENTYSTSTFSLSRFGNNQIFLSFVDSGSTIFDSYSQIRSSVGGVNSYTSFYPDRTEFEKIAGYNNDKIANYTDRTLPDWGNVKKVIHDSLVNLPNCIPITGTDSITGNLNAIVQDFQVGRTTDATNGQSNIFFHSDPTDASVSIAAGTPLSFVSQVQLETTTSSSVCNLQVYDVFNLSTSRRILGLSAGSAFLFTGQDAQYAADYSSSYTSRSFPDKNYVDTHLSGKALAVPSSGQNGQSIRWNNTTPAWEYFTAGTGSGTVSSVGLSMPSIYSTAGSPVTSTGTLTVTLANQVATSIWGNFTSGSTTPSFNAATADGQFLVRRSGALTFGTIVSGDIPTLNQSTTGSAATLTTGRTVGMTSDVVWTSPSFNGSSNVTAAATIQPNAITTTKIIDDAVTLPKIANIGARTILANAGTSSSSPTETPIDSAMGFWNGRLTTNTKSRTTSTSPIVLADSDYDGIIYWQGTGIASVTITSTGLRPKFKCAIVNDSTGKVGFSVSSPVTHLSAIADSLLIQDAWAMIYVRNSTSVDITGALGEGKPIVLNGVHLDGDTIKWGGDLIADTELNLNAHTLNMVAGDPAGGGNLVFVPSGVEIIASDTGNLRGSQVFMQAINVSGPNELSFSILGLSADTNQGVSASYYDRGLGTSMFIGRDSTTFIGGGYRASLGKDGSYFNASLVLKKDVSYSTPSYPVSPRSFLELQSNNNLFILPKNTTSEIGAIGATGSTDAGSLVYDKTLNVLKYFNGTTWAILGNLSSVTSFDANATVTNSTTTPVIRIISAPKWQSARNIAGNSIDGSANVAFSNKFIVQGTSDAGLSGAQFLGALGTGLVKNIISTGILSIAVAGTDYQVPLIISTGLTKSVNTITNDLSTGVSGQGNLTGSTSTTTGVTYKTTTGVGTVGADHIFTGGNNGATEFMRILNSGRVGIGTNTPLSKLHVKGYLRLDSSIGTGNRALKVKASGLVYDSTEWGIATASNFGVIKLYTSSGSNTDGSITQQAFTTGVSTINASILNNGVNYILTSGTNTYTGGSGFTSYTDGQIFTIRIAGASTSTGASTLNIASLGAKKIFEDRSTQAGAGDLQAMYDYILVYDASLDAASGGFLMTNQGSVFGTTTNTAAASGFVGESQTSFVSSGSAISLITATTSTVTGINLPAGDWTCSGNVNYVSTTATVSGKVSGLSTSNTTMPSDGSEVYNGSQMTLITTTDGITLARKRFSLSTTTTVYTLAKATFSAGTVAAYGYLGCIRER